MLCEVSRPRTLDVQFVNFRKSLSGLRTRRWIAEITIEQASPVNEATDLCNEQLADPPNFFKFSPDGFVRGSGVTVDELSDRTVVVARDAGRLLGFADLADHVGGNADQSGFGVIRSLLYR